MTFLFFKKTQLRLSLARSLLYILPTVEIEEEHFLTMLSLRWNELRSLYMELIVGCGAVVVVIVVFGAAAVGSELRWSPSSIVLFFY